jgi:hypothetical protein
MELEEARRILGDVAKGMTDEQIQDQLTKIQYLAESWLDNYERSIFEGKTLNEFVQT